MNDTASSKGGDAALLEELRGACERVRAQIAKVVVGQEGDDRSAAGRDPRRRPRAPRRRPRPREDAARRDARAARSSLTFARIQFTPDLMPSDITGHRDHRGGPHDAAARASASCTGPSSRNCSSPTRSTARRRRRRPPCWRRCRSGRSPPAATTPRAARAVLRPRDAEPDRAGGHLSAARGAARPLPVQGRRRLPERARPSAEVYRLSSATATSPSGPRRGPEILALQELVRRVPVSDVVLDYAVSLARATRPTSPTRPTLVKKWVEYGAGPRGGPGADHLRAARARR